MTKPKAKPKTAKPAVPPPIGPVYETVPIDSIHADPANVRMHPERNLATIKASLARFGQQKPIVVDAAGIVRAGNGTLDAARALGWTEIRIVRSDLAGSEATAYAIADNRSAELAEWDGVGLAETLRSLQSEEFELEAIGYTLDEVDSLVEGIGTAMLGGSNPATSADPPPADRPTLADRFIIPPFSVLDARQGYWQDRKRAWLALGIQSELGRGGGCTNTATPPPSSDKAEPSDLTEARCIPSRAEPSRAEPSRAEPSRAEPSVSKMAMANDPMQRKRAYAPAAPGGSPRPAMRLVDGRTVRGNGAGRAL